MRPGHISSNSALAQRSNSIGLAIHLDALLLCLEAVGRLDEPLTTGAGYLLKLNSDTERRLARPTVTPQLSDDLYLAAGAT